MVDGLTRDVTAEEIGAFRETGVVSLKGILRRGSTFWSIRTPLAMPVRFKCMHSRT